ncbi:hypothetical protein PMZ80_010323 [Knufia obscura]|uniref:Uncharacterized protein n=1 Tax=Knufia obscura TaxID=1635080 RepID=A0ABR0R9P4_9EURO|nr:hypothetical protein PMZ80_010323 [Knufia obscura]
MAGHEPEANPDVDEMPAHHSQPPGKANSCVRSLYGIATSKTAMMRPDCLVRLRAPAVALSAYPDTDTSRAGIVNQHFQTASDDYDERYNPDKYPLPQRQQQNPQPLAHRPPSAAGSSSARSLRRTPRLQERLASSLLVPAQPAPTSLPAEPPQAQAQPRSTPREQVTFTKSGSTTPQSFQTLVQDEFYWPRRTTRVSRRTHEAILFALEAVRTGRGVDAQQLTVDRLEEEARMSDMYMSNAQGSAQARQQQDARAQAEAAAQARITTPRQIMAARTAREARKAEQEARQRQTQETDPSRRRQQENVVGVGADPRRQQAQSSRPQYSEPETAARIHAGQSVTIGGRSDPVPTTNGLGPRGGNTAVNQGQPRPVASQQTTQPQMPPLSQPGYTPGDASRVQRNRTEAYEKLEMPAVAGSKPPQTQDQNYTQPSTSLQPARTGFPHAFERWETLSSHWEGLTSYWIRRLQENTNELDGKPIDKQMARQITDLSAAGANLFHAVVELQRLRASSERKFQRWFFETRNEQEQAQEKLAQLQAQVQQERQNPPQASSASVDAMRAEKNKAEELVREMRRELQISKEEARRAWEELGRREQEERERTIALRSGEPTLIGGVQVLPMQGLSSRHNTTSSQRPVTRDGPYQGGPTATHMGGQQPPSRSQTTLESPIQEQAQFYYQPDTTSSTDTDPFTEAARQTEPPLPLRHEPDTRFVQTSSPAARQPPTTQQQSLSAARAAAAASPAHSQRSTHNRSDVPSYIPSTRSGAGSAQSEEEYHIGPDGQYLRDPHGRPIPYRQPLGGYEDIASDDEDHTADIERERLLAEQYAHRQQASYRTSPGQAQPQSQSPQQHLPSSAYTAATITPQPQQTPFFESSPGARTTSSTISPITPQQQPHMANRLTSPMHDPADYEGAAYGQDEDLEQQQEEDQGHMYPPPSGQAPITPRHHVPTRLSDILEERTEPSRSSAISNTPTTYSETQNYPQGGVFGTRR